MNDRDKSAFDKAAEAAFEKAPLVQAIASRNATSSRDIYLWCEAYGAGAAHARQQDASAGDYNEWAREYYGWHGEEPPLQCKQAYADATSRRVDQDAELLERCVVEIQSFVRAVPIFWEGERREKLLADIAARKAGGNVPTK